MYCENCHLTVEESRCPECRSKKLRPPRPGDSCRLCEQPVMWGEMLLDVLRQNGVPAVPVKSTFGGLGLKLGPMMERVGIYVPYERLPEARELMDGLLGADGEAAAAEPSDGPEERGEEHYPDQPDFLKKQTEEYFASDARKPE